MINCQADDDYDSDVDDDYDSDGDDEGIMGFC